MFSGIISLLTFCSIFCLSTTCTIGICGFILLGIIQGMTEFLPISSTAHVLIASKICGHNISPEQWKNILIFLQMGTCISGCVFFKKDILCICRGIFSNDQHGWHLLIILLLGILPTAAIGLCLPTINYNPTMLSIGLTIGAAMIPIAEWKYKKQRIHKSMLSSITYYDAILIGLMQSMAIFPGISRSMITIIAGYICTFSRHLSVHYSFLLGTFTGAAASIYKCLSPSHAGVHAWQYTIPIICSFLTGMMCISICLSFLKKYGLLIFSPYRLILAIAVLYCL